MVYIQTAFLLAVTAALIFAAEKYNEKIPVKAMLGAAAAAVVLSFIFYRMIKADTFLTYYDATEMIYRSKSFNASIFFSLFIVLPIWGIAYVELHVSEFIRDTFRVVTRNGRQVSRKHIKSERTADEVDSAIKAAYVSGFIINACLVILLFAVPGWMKVHSIAKEKLLKEKRVETAIKSLNNIPGNFTEEEKLYRIIFDLPCGGHKGFTYEDYLIKYVAKLEKDDEFFAELSRLELMAKSAACETTAMMAINKIIALNEKGIITKENAVKVFAAIEENSLYKKVRTIAKLSKKIINNNGEQVTGNR